MITYGAYNAGLPCKNPNCKSYGAPHPNCRCYGDFASGGEASFCSEARMHAPGCEYYAEGGAAPSPGVAAPPPGQGFWEDDAATSGQAPPTSPAAPPPAGDFWEDDTQAAAAPSSFWEDDAAPGHDLTPTPQTAGAIAEGVAQGFGGPGAIAAEVGYGGLGSSGRTAVGTVLKHLGPVGAALSTGLSAIPEGTTAADIAARQQDNPVGSAIGKTAGTALGLMTGAGEAGMASEAANAAARVAGLGKVGSAIFRGAVTNGLIQGGDEISKAMLGQGDPEAPVASAMVNVGAASLLGAAGGATGALISGAKVGSKLDGFLTGLSVAAAADPELEAMAKDTIGSHAAFNYGKKFYQNIMKKLSVPLTVTTSAGALEGYRQGGVGGALIGAGEGMLTGLGLNLTGRLASRYASPAIARMIASGTASNLWTGTVIPVLDHAANVSGGARMIQSGIDGLFKVGSQQIIDNAGLEKERQKLDEYIKNGGIGQNIQEQIYQDKAAPQPQGYADGGDVLPPDDPGGVGAVDPLLKPSDPLATFFPEQNLLMATAKGRISNYLSSLRPQENLPKLAFDEEPDQTEKTKTYHRALDIANRPLIILNDIKKGTVEPEDVGHFNALYPEVAAHLQKRITERITKAQLKGEKPSYLVRQGLSMFLGAPLSGEITPQAVAAAQAVYAKPQQQQGGGAQKAKHGTAPLSKSSEAYLTSDQARGRRQQAAH